MSDSYVSRLPRPGRQATPRTWPAAAVATCPVCVEGTFRAVWLSSTVLLVCDHGCPGRRIAVELGLDGWPERTR
jgi:hypothetical protein